MFIIYILHKKNININTFKIQQFIKKQRKQQHNYTINH